MTLGSSLLVISQTSVFSCFNVKPRRRRHESEPVNDRRAFRLCIAKKDRDLLQDESKWPESVIVSEWFHVNLANRRPEHNVCETAAAARVRSPTVLDACNNNETNDTVVYGPDITTGTEIAERMDLNTIDDRGELF